jgi:hypothetical protein
MRVSQPLSATGKAGTRAWYSCHGLTLEVEQHGPRDEPVLERFLEGLWWVRTADGVRRPRLRLSISLHDRGLRVPRGIQPMSGLDGFQGLAVEHEFYLTDGRSLLHVQPRRGQGSAQLAPDFFARPLHSQQLFWMFGLLKLLRPLGAYWLHSAGLVSREGVGILIIGGSGGGKSTLTIDLIRQGWSYLSDDALLLHRQPAGVAALAWRKHVSVDAAAAGAYADLPLGDEAADSTGGRKRRVEIEEVYPGQLVASCLPRVLLFSRVMPHAPSAVMPLDRPTALKQLLAQSGPPLFDHATMAQHFELLTRLLQQATPYELSAGLDIYQKPGRLLQLLASVNGGTLCPGC